jgi:hypothetical protein
MNISHQEGPVMSSAMVHAAAPGPTVNVIADLRAATPTDLPIQVLGYHTINDEGGGLFYWVADDITPEDFGHVFASSSGNVGRWHRFLESPWINVKHFGAMEYDKTDPDRTNSTLAFRRAIAAASIVRSGEWNSGTVVGGTVVVPAGNYLISNLYIDRPIVLTGVSGDAYGGTTLRVKSGTVPDTSENQQNPYERPWIGKPYNGIIVISTDSLIVPHASGAGNGATISNLTIRPESTKPEDNAKPINPGDGLWVPVNGGNGIFIESSSQVTIRKVNISFMLGHAIGVSYGGTHTFHTRIEDCVLTGNRQDGLYISGGSDNNLGYFASIQANDNGGYGFQNRAASSSTFVSCHAERNLLGSFKQVGPAGGSVYVGCYWEADQLATAAYGSAPDMQFALFVGGQGSRPGRKGGPEERIGFESARLGFQDQSEWGQFRGFIPDGIHQSMFNFRYQPDFPAGAISGPQSQFWGLRRHSLGHPEFILSGTEAIPTLTGYTEGTAALPYYDRCWVFELETSDYFTPFGWTDENHPRGPGHLFIGKPVINQKCHWTLRQQATLQPKSPANCLGRTVVTMLLNEYWLTPEDGAELGLTFSLDVSGQDLAGIDLRVGAHAITTGAGGSNMVHVVVYNDGVSAVTADVVARCEHAKRWSANYPQYG